MGGRRKRAEAVSREAEGQRLNLIERLVIQTNG